MIELLLQAERALSMGLVDQAERTYRTAIEADPRNSIAVVGLARVALERGDDAEAWRQAKRALAIDGENAAARRLVDRMEEVWRHRGTPLPDADVPAVEPDAADVVGGAVPPLPAPTPSGTSAPRPEPTTSARPPQPKTPASRPGLVDRLLRRKRT